MSIAGYIIAAVGILLGLVGDVMILTAVYRRGAILFITCVVLPLAAWAFALVHFRRLWLPLALSIGGVLIAGLGVWLSGSERFAEVFFG
jgi:hypothetical protein